MKITFVNGKSECGCIMDFSDGHREYSDVHTITLCNSHENINNLIAENAALRKAIDGVHHELYGQGFEVLGWHLNGETEPLDNWFGDNDWDPETPATDAILTEIAAKPMDNLAGVAETMLVKYSNAGVSHCRDAEGWRLVKRQAETESAKLRGIAKYE